MAGRSPDVTVSSGRRGYIRYQYGDHYWVPEVQADWSRGIVRDTPRVAIPPGSVYDASDYLLHQVGIAQKRGGTSYAGPALTGGAPFNVTGVAFARFAAGPKLVGVAGNGHIHTVTAGATTDLGGSIAPTVDKPKFRVGGAKQLLVIPLYDGVSQPVKWDGTAAPAVLGGSPPAGKFSCLYKTRLALGNSTANPNRIYFSPTPDIESTWDTANSWIDTDYAITGLASLANAILVFSESTMQRIIGSTPPPNTDMDLAPVTDGEGCTDARSITLSEGYCYFANPRGVYVTNGTTPVSLTAQGGIETYWQSLFAGYDLTTWKITTGMLRSFLFVTVLDNNDSFVAALMCNPKRAAWWRLTNVSPYMFATATGANDELYYADASAPRVVAMSGIFNPTSSNKNDANGTAVLPTLELAPFGGGTGVKSYGWGHLNYDMRDAASDNPTLAVTVKGGIEADTTWTPPESPLTETTTLDRRRFSVNRTAQSLTYRIVQSNASAKTELYAIDVLSRPQSLVGEGVT